MVHNFNAGPSILPAEVFEQAAAAIHDFNGTGLSILEVGHRTPVFEAVMNEALSLSRELMHLSDDKEVMFLHGGATTQFFQVPMNFLPDTHVVVLPASRVVGPLEDAWDRLRAASAAPMAAATMPRTVNLVTGPSRTGDIEQKIEMGAHGPRRLHLIVVEDDALA